jgi:hypothetical protein
MPDDIERQVREMIETGNIDPKVLERILAAASADPALLDRVNQMLVDAGATEVGSGPPLDIAEFYVERPGTFQLRWPLSLTLGLPMSFDALDRKTQFFVLWNEWARRELEGMTALNGGQVEDAEKAFRECVERAEQLEVDELIARSYEGLMRVAQKRGDRVAERRWSEKAASARAR